MPNARYKEYGAAGPALVLIHGWSGSSKYFQRNVDELAKSCRVVTLDLRFHGESDKPAWGFHVARLAADVHALIQGTWLADARPALLGTSLGCAVIWSYVELFGEDRCSKFIFVDQAPSQWVFPDWKLGSKGIYDAASLENIQKAVQDMDSFADGNAACCLSKPPSGEDSGAHKKKPKRSLPTSGQPCAFMLAADVLHQLRLTSHVARVLTRSIALLSPDAHPPPSSPRSLSQLIS